MNVRRLPLVRRRSLILGFHVVNASKRIYHILLLLHFEHLLVFLWVSFFVPFLAGLLLFILVARLTGRAFLISVLSILFKCNILHFIGVFAHLSILILVITATTCLLIFIIWLILTIFWNWLVLFFNFTYFFALILTIFDFFGLLDILSILASLLANKSTLLLGGLLLNCFRFILLACFWRNFVNRNVCLLTDTLI